MLKSGDVTLGIVEKPDGSLPAPGSEDRRRFTQHWTPVHLDIQVDDFAVTLERLVAAGGVCEQAFDRNGRPNTAFCADPFGNGFRLMETRG